MKSKKLVSLVLGATLIVSTALVGCGDNDKKPDDKKKDPPNVTKIDKEQYLNINLGIEPKSLDLSRANDIYGAQVFTEVYEGLTRVEQDKDGKDVIKAAGAKTWEHNDEGTVWTFHLRDYNWTDGKKVTAKDFVYSILRTLDPNTASSYAFLLSPIKGADEYNASKGSKDAVGVKAVDDNTLEFTLKQPCPYFLDLTYFKLFLPQREDIVKKHGEKYGTEASTLEVYCGPFVVKEWSHQQQIVLEKNDKYWDKDSVKLQKVNLKMIKEANAAYGSLLNGTLDTGGVKNPEWIKKFEQKKDKMDNIKGFRPSTGYIFFNQKDKLLSNANVRKAFSIAYTRDDYANVITYGINAPAYGWCPPTVQLGGKDYRELANEEPIKKMIEDNKDPKELLIKGLKELGMDPDPSKVTVSILHGNTNADTRKSAEYEQEMYKKILGVNVKAEYMTFDILQKRTDEMDYQIAGMGWMGDYNDPNTFFDMWMTGAGMVPTGWSNKKYDELLKKAMSSIDEKERLEAYKEAEKILLVEDAVVVPTTYSRKNTYRYKYVKDLMTPLFGCDFEFKYAYTDGRGK